MALAAALLVVLEAVQLNVQSSLVSLSSTSLGAQTGMALRAVPLQRGYEPPDELDAELTPQNSSVAAALSSALFQELSAAQERRLDFLKNSKAISTLVEVSNHEFDVVRNLNARDDPTMERGVSGPVGVHRVDAEGADWEGSEHGRPKDALLEASKRTDEAEGATYLDMVASVQTSPTADIGLLSVRDTQYMGWIRVGSEESADGDIGVPMRVVFDTGSTNLWITGSKCSKDLHEKYRQDASKTYVKSKDYLVHIKFGTGQLSGKTARDRVKVGPFQIPKPGCAIGSTERGCIAQMFGVIDDEVGNIFAELDDFGGILGLGHRDMSMMSPESATVWEDADGHVTPFFEHLVETQQLSTPEFSMYMNAQKNKYSAILFGGVDSRVVKKRPGQQMFDLARVKGRGGETGREPHYWSVELYRIVYNKEKKDLKHHVGKCSGRTDGKCEKVLQASFTPSQWNPRDSSSDEKVKADYSCEGGAKKCHQNLDYHQDPALVFDSGTTLYTGPQAGVDEILEWIPNVKCGDLTEQIGSITYEVQGLHDPSAVCDDECPCVGRDCPTPTAKGKQYCTLVSNQKGYTWWNEDFSHFRQSDCTAEAESPELCRCLHRHKEKHTVDIVLQPHQFMVHDGGGSGGSVENMNCRPGFWTINVPEPNGPAWLLGELFMRHFVTVYRHEPPTAKQEPACIKPEGLDRKKWIRPSKCDPALVAWAPAEHSEQDTDHAAFVRDLSDMAPGYKVGKPKQVHNKAPDQIAKETKDMGRETGERIDYTSALKSSTPDDRDAELLKLLKQKNSDGWPEQLSQCASKCPTATACPEDCPYVKDQINHWKDVLYTLDHRVKRNSESEDRKVYQVGAAPDVLDDGNKRWPDREEVQGTKSLKDHMGGNAAWQKKLDARAALELGNTSGRKRTQGLGKPIRPIASLS